MKESMRTKQARLLLWVMLFAPNRETVGLGGPNGAAGDVISEEGSSTAVISKIGSSSAAVISEIGLSSAAVISEIETVLDPSVTSHFISDSSTASTAQTSTTKTPLQLLEWPSSDRGVPSSPSSPSRPSSTTSPSRPSSQSSPSHSSSTTSPSSTTIPSSTKISARTRLTPAIKTDWPKCCPLGELLYDDLSSQPSCELMQAAPDSAVHQPTGHQPTGLLLGGGRQVKLECQEGQEVRTLIWETDFLIIEDEDDPKMIIPAHNLSLPLRSFCLEMGIQDGMAMQLFGQACLQATGQPHLSVCPGRKTHMHMEDHHHHHHRHHHHVMEESTPNCSHSQELPQPLSLAGASVLYLGQTLASRDYCLLSMGQDGQGQGLVCSTMLGDITPLPLYQRALMQVLYLISTFFLFLVLLITVTVAELRSSLFGWMKISVLTSMLSFYSFMTLIDFGGVDFIIEKPLMCQFSGFMIHYSFLVSFFWLNTMSFDIWRTFCQLRGYGSMLQRIHQRRRRFCWYSLYAWGTPALILLVSVVVEWSPSSWGLPKPRHGTESCLFPNHQARVIYLQIPSAVLLALNAVFFGLASWALLFGIWATPDMIRRPIIQRFWIVLWLFFTMGLPWIVDCFSGFFEDKQHIFTFGFDVINGLQGLIIFLIFTLKDGIKNSLQKMWHALKAFFLPRALGPSPAPLKLPLSSSWSNQTSLSNQHSSLASSWSVQTSLSTISRQLSRTSRGPDQPDQTSLSTISRQLSRSNRGPEQEEDSPHQISLSTCLSTISRQLSRSSRGPDQPQTRLNQTSLSTISRQLSRNSRGPEQEEDSPHQTSLSTSLSTISRQLSRTSRGPDQPQTRLDQTSLSTISRQLSRSSNGPDQPQTRLDQTSLSTISKQLSRSRRGPDQPQTRLDQTSLSTISRQLSRSSRGPDQGEDSKV